MRRILEAIRTVFADDRPHSERQLRNEIRARAGKKIIAGTAVILLLGILFFTLHGNYVAMYYWTAESGITEGDVDVSFRDEGILNLRGIHVRGRVVRVDIGPAERGRTEAYVKIGREIYTENIDNSGPVIFRPSQRSFPCWQMILVMGLMFCGWCAFLSVTEYRRLKGPERFSYTAVYLLGMTVFFLVICTGIGILLGFLIADPTAFNFYKVLSWTQTVMLYFTLVMAPGLIIFSAALSISNIQLIRKEGFRFVNLLGIILSFMIVAGMAGGVVLLELTRLAVPYAVCMFMMNTYYGIYAYLICLLIGVCLAFIRIRGYTPSYDKGYIVILGCAIRDDGTLYPLIRGRVDRAISFAEEQTAAGGPEPVFIPSGGKGDDEPVSEAEAMADYLISKGIPEDRVFPETRSVNTKQNMLFSHEIAERECPGTMGAFSTTNYHVFRSGVIAASQGLSLDGMGARTKWYFSPNALIREFIGLLVDDIGEVLKFSVFIVVFCLIIFLVIR